MKVSFEQIGHMSATFRVDSGEDGQVVKVSGDGAVAACADGDKFCGVLEGVRKGYGGVQLHGFATVAYSGTAPAVGYAGLLADGSGGVKTGSGREHLVVSVDTVSKTCVIEL